MLAEHCIAEGRDPNAIQKTILGGPDPISDPDGFLTAIEQYAALGISHVQFMPPAPALSHTSARSATPSSLASLRSGELTLSERDGRAGSDLVDGFDGGLSLRRVAHG